MDTASHSGHGAVTSAQSNPTSASPMGGWIDPAVRNMHAPASACAGATSTSTLSPSEKAPRPAVGVDLAPSSDHAHTHTNLPAHRHPLVARLTLHLAPSFFSITMGTGITSILLRTFPYSARWLDRLGDVVFVLNIVLFTLIAAGSIVRYAYWRGLFSATLRHPVSGLFWGCMPMGFATIVNMVAITCVPAWGEHWARLALGLWWIDAIISVLVNFGMIYTLIITHPITPASVSPALLLPIVSSVVAAASGGLVASSLAPFSPLLARSTLLVAIIIWGTGVPLAMLVIGLWLGRAITHGPPAGAALAAAFLPLGPCGQGAFGAVVIGRTVREMAYRYGVGFGLDLEPLASVRDGAAATATDSALRVADGVYALGLCVGMVLWGLGLCWYLIASALMLRHIFTGRATAAATPNVSPAVSKSVQPSSSPAPTPAPRPAPSPAAPLFGTTNSATRGVSPGTLSSRTAVSASSTVSDPCSPSLRPSAPRPSPFRRLLSPPFSLSLWALTFPIGVFATGTNALAQELHSPALRVIGAFLSAQVVLHWLWVGGWTGWELLLAAYYPRTRSRGGDGQAQTQAQGAEQKRSKGGVALRAPEVEGWMKERKARERARGRGGTGREEEV